MNVTTVEPHDQITRFHFSPLTDNFPMNFLDCVQGELQNPYGFLGRGVVSITSSTTACRERRLPMQETIERDKSNRIRIFRSVFRGREDAYGAGSGACVREPVTDEVILGHLQGKRRIGVYPLLQDGAVHFAVVDIDEPDLGRAQAYLDVADTYGLTIYLEASKSKGFHLWHFFAEPVPAAKARELIRWILRDAGLPPKTEIFPKQDQLSGSESLGNYINLPLFGADVLNGRTVFLNGEFQPYANQFAFLSGVEKITHSQLEELLEPDDTGKDKSAPLSDGSVQAVGSYSDMLPCVQRMMQGVSEGCRDTAAFTLAKHFRVEKRFPQDATLEILRMWNQRNAPPLDARIIEQKVKGAYLGRSGKGYTSFGCGNQLIEQFCVKDSSCPIFKRRAGGQAKKRPVTVDKPYFKHKAFVPKRLADEIMADNRFIYVGGQLHRYVNGVYRSGGEQFIEMESQKRLGEESRQRRIAEVVYYVQVASYTDPDELNKNTDVINLKNGLLEWRAGKLHLHDPDCLSTIQIPVEYDPEARCPVVDHFLVTTLPPDCIHLAEELFGYCLIPDVRFNKAFMLYGTGANGKSTFLTLLEAFVGGDNVAKIPLQELAENRFKRADLSAKLVNLFADLDTKSLESSSYFKTIVSGDMIDAERKHRDPFYFRPFARLVFSANEVPRSGDRSFAYYRRWCIIRFPNQFTDENADRDLAAKLMKPSELSGLLNRALRGLERLLEQGHFTESETTKGALEDYKKENDTAVAFVSERCELAPKLRIERPELYAAYEEYCADEGFRVVSRQRFYKTLRSYPQIGEVMGDKGAHFFTGIQLKED